MGEYRVNSGSDGGRLLVIRRQGKILTLLFQKDILVQAGAEKSGSNIVGNIYVGKVKHIASNIDAAFVEYRKGGLCFLPLRECRAPILTNRVYDGRLLAGDEIVLQINRESLKTKEPGATANLSFDGKYTVLTTSRKKIGFSAKIPPKKKKWLKEQTEKDEVFMRASQQFGIIFRTNAGMLTETAPLIREVEKLRQQAEELMLTALHRTCFSLLKKSPERYIGRLKDLYSGAYEKILTDDRGLYEELKAYLTEEQPEDVGKLTFYEDAMLPLYKLYRVETGLSQALGRRVWMKSGAYLVIEYTEALTCIDVNTGKCTSGKKSEELFYSINLEAAGEIARQLSLRNISGIIIVDFISMNSERNRRLLMDEFKNMLEKDAVKTELVDMTPLGLVEITRKKVLKPFYEQIREEASEA